VSATTALEQKAVVRPAVLAGRNIRPGRVVLHAFLIAMCALWIFPLFWAVYSSLRPISDTVTHGYVSLPAGGLSLENFKAFWTEADLPYYYANTLVIVVPSVVLILLLASMSHLHAPSSPGAST